MHIKFIGPTWLSYENIGKMQNSTITVFLWETANRLFQLVRNGSPGSRPFDWLIFSEKNLVWPESQLDSLQSAIDKIAIIKVYICMHNKFNKIFELTTSTLIKQTTLLSSLFTADEI